jgi:hypothetical protein
MALTRRRGRRGQSGRRWETVRSRRSSDRPQRQLSSGRSADRPPGRRRAQTLTLALGTLLCGASQATLIMVVIERDRMFVGAIASARWERDCGRRSKCARSGRLTRGTMLAGPGWLAQRGTPPLIGGAGRRTVQDRAPRRPSGVRTAHRRGVCRLREECSHGRVPEIRPAPLAARRILDRSGRRLLQTAVCGRSWLHHCNRKWFRRPPRLRSAGGAECDRDHQRRDGARDRAIAETRRPSDQHPRNRRRRELLDSGGAQLPLIRLRRRFKPGWRNWQTHRT